MPTWHIPMLLLHPHHAHNMLTPHIPMLLPCHLTTLAPHCHAHAAHMTRSHAQCSIGIAVCAAISHNRRYLKKSTESGIEDQGRATVAEMAGKSPRSTGGTTPQSV